ncbi:Putative L-lactate dehydrogenase operon regulatory protein [Gordonia insulae]|uniref:L-lactate dehydrogenase operon regulatory protein n=2 Tax=Gordonia insulae TaxID=2420509 RepID=A0A3G8JSA0_9ACTN|nr:GntR family transcriptional regulator [Gordonia insulae]AZG47793.1 Putative L-lactate dehydrogenase operon regulatory protein [Gordonia insulae]
MSVSQDNSQGRKRILTPLVQESTPAIIARKLHDAIASGNFPPGSQLTESGLAADLGVSRGPLREAMQRLTAEGLLVSHRNRGLFVVSMDDDDIRDMYVARTAVERAAVAELIVRRDSGAVDDLNDAVARMRAFIDHPNSAEMAEADMEFHQILVEHAHSQRLSRLHETILVETRMCLRAMRGTYSSGKERIDEHQALVDAIAAGDAPAADRLMIEHMKDGLHRLVGVGEPSEASSA